MFIPPTFVGAEIDHLAPQQVGYYLDRLCAS
jgi:hypothetical protein